MKQIIDYPDYYVTDTGEVWSLKSGRLRKLKHWSCRGYSWVRLSATKNTAIGKSIHRLVAEAFIPNPANLPYVCHKNDIRSDNRASNLFWGTHQDNMNDMYSKGRGPDNSGENHGNAKLTEVQVLNIRSKYPAVTIRELASEYGVRLTTIRDIIKRLTWKHIP